MRRLLAIIAIMIVVSAARAADRPNIVLFVSDDHRADVLGCAGHAIVKTPNIDALAARGIRYRNAFVTTSICAASRATILTGLVERTHGYTFGAAPISRPHMVDSYPVRLRSAGYRSGFVGKFGVQVEGGSATIDTMFDVYVPLTRRGERRGSVTRHFTDVLGDKAIEFIASTPKGTPFCLSVSFNAAHASDGDKQEHYPYPATEAPLYDGVVMPRPRLDGGVAFEALPAFLRNSMNRDRYFWRWDSDEKYQRNLQNYFRMISGLDRNIGRVIAELDKRALSGNTIVVFIGDNGYYMGERGLAGKWSHYDESLRVPLVLCDPRESSQHGEVRDEFALNLDIAPTLLALAGIEVPKRYQGASLTNTATLALRDGFYCEHRMEHDRIPKWQGFRGKRFVYANYYEQPVAGELLHDLAKDPDERVNVAKDPAYRKTLRRWRVRTRKLSGQYFEEGLPDPAGLPRVLILGDSIAMGYHQRVREQLKRETVVVRPGENCAGTTKGVRRIDEWLALDGGHFDVIHFNFGLHDLKAVTEPGGSKATNNPDDPRQADLATYERQLREIVAKLVATKAKLIFATTTPFPSGVNPHRDPEDAARYNAVALAIMKENGIAIDDLYAFALPRLADIQRPVNVHFTPKGSNLLGDAVVEHLRKALATRIDGGGRGH